MKRIVWLAFTIFALAVLPLSGAFAQEAPPVPVVAEPEAVVEAPAEPAESPELDLNLPAEALIFLDAADDVAYSTCCLTGNASCQASCAGNVRTFSCSRVGARGCTTTCYCF